MKYVPLCHSLVHPPKKEKISPANDLELLLVCFLFLAGYYWWSTFVWFQSFTCLWSPYMLILPWLSCMFLLKAWAKFIVVTRLVEFSISSALKFSTKPAVNMSTCWSACTEVALTRRVWNWSLFFSIISVCLKLISFPKGFLISGAQT